MWERNHADKNRRAVPLRFALHRPVLDVTASIGYYQKRHSEEAKKDRPPRHNHSNDLRLVDY